MKVVIRFNLFIGNCEECSSINIQNKKSIINKNEYNDLIEYSKNPQKVIKKRTVSN